MKLANKVSIVTGAASGIGAAIARTFVEEGSTVVAADINSSNGTKLVKELNSGKEQAIFIQADMRRLPDLKQIVDKSLEMFKRIDILCNNAGYGISGTVLTTNEQEYDNIMNINMKGMFFLSKYVLEHMVSQKRGTIVNIASIAGLVGLKERAAYCASKGAVVAFTRAIALDHVSQNIRINCICPGTVNTPWVQSRLQESKNPEETLKMMSARQPMGRLGTPEEIAKAALYLASDDASFVTGNALIVDGGLTAG